MLPSSFGELGFGKKPIPKLPSTLAKGEPKFVTLC